MKKTILILMTLIIANCAQRASMIEETTVEMIDESPKEEYVWVYDPEPWTAPVDSAKPNILSLGDSISVGYMAALTRELPEYDVMHPNDNCRNSFYTLENVDSWLAQFPNNDVIIWNNGVWDSTTDYWYNTNKDFVKSPSSWYGTTLAQYESNLIAIARKLKSTGSRVIFLTTTDIHSPPFEPLKEIQLNEIAKRVLPAEGIEIMDLHAVSMSISNAHPNQWDVHFTRDANITFAKEINKFIRGL